MLEQKEWLYDRGENRHKHRWKHDRAGFEPEGRHGIGKCHSSITPEIAQELLRNGVTYRAPGSEEITHIYAVYRGAIYEAAPTSPGLSYHGYPWKGDQGRPALPPRIIRELHARAASDNYSKEFEDWLKKFS